MTNNDKRRVLELMETIKNALVEMQELVEDGGASTLVKDSEEDADPKKISEKKVSNLLKEIGIPANIKGYRYITYGVVLLSENKGESMTKFIYPGIAKEFGTTGTRVERAIRHAVEKSFYGGKWDKLKGLFGNTASLKNGKVTNSEFLYTLVDYFEVGLDK